MIKAATIVTVIASVLLLAGVRAVEIKTSVGAVSYIAASNACAPSQRLCTVAELTADQANPLNRGYSVWVLATIGDSAAYSGAFSNNQFTRGANREDFVNGVHYAACCAFNGLGVSNYFATGFTAQTDACPTGYDTSVDLNRNAKKSGGNHVYMCTQYTRADTLNTNNLLTDLTVVSSSSKTVSCPSGYNKLDLDLNSGAGGNFIYFCALWSTTDSRAIVDTYVVDGKAAQCLPDYTRIDQDLNEGAGGDFLYLCFKRTNRGLKYLADPSADVNKIATFSPGFHLSKRERFFPVSIETLLASTASAVYNHQSVEGSNFVFPMGSLGDASPCTAAMIAAGDCTPINSMSQFSNFNVDDKWCFGFSATNGAEDHTDWYTSDRTNAKVYYSVQRAASGSDEHALITFMVLYRWNGCVHYLDCQPSARLCNLASALAIEHMGDVERLSVLVDRTYTRVLAVELEKHGNAAGYRLLEYPGGYTGTVGGSGPHVYVAAETHGHFPTSSTNNPGQDSYTQECHACSGCSNCECYEPIWQPDATQLVRVGKKTEFPNAAGKDVWVDGQEFQRFGGRFGCGAKPYADWSGVSAFVWRWWLKQSSIPSGWHAPITSDPDWHSPADS